MKLDILVYTEDERVL